MVAVVKILQEVLDRRRIAWIIMLFLIEGRELFPTPLCSIIDF